MGEILQFRAFQFADLLTSGLVGEELTAALRKHFADISRADVFLGVRIAISIFVADQLEANLERDAARAEGVTNRLDLDSAQIELGYLRRQVEVMRGEGAWLDIAKMPDPAIPREAAHG